MKLQDYSQPSTIKGVKVIDLVKHEDDGGSFVELGRFTSHYEPHIYDENESFFEGDDLQINHSYLEHGVVKAYHVHKKQTDIWYVMNKAIVHLVDYRGGEPTSFNMSDMRLVVGHKPQLIVIPPGVAHGIATPYGPVNMIYLVNEFFNPNDEFRLPWNSFGKDVWEVTKG